MSYCVVCSVGLLMSYCVVCVVLYLYGSFPPVVCSIGGFISYCVVCVVLYLYTRRHEPSYTTNNTI
jgi:CHASE2 domain-containing sensor protein